MSKNERTTSRKASFSVEPPGEKPSTPIEERVLKSAEIKGIILAVVGALLIILYASVVGALLIVLFACMSTSF